MQESLLSKDRDTADGSEQGDYGDKTWGQSYLSRKRMTGLILGGVFFLVFLIVFNNVSDDPKYAEVNETLAVLFGW